MSVYHLCHVKPVDEHSGSQAGSGLRMSFLYLCMSFNSLNGKIFSSDKQRMRERKEEVKMSGSVGVCVRQREEAVSE